MAEAELWKGLTEMKILFCVVLLSSVFCRGVSFPITEDPRKNAGYNDNENDADQNDQPFGDAYVNAAIHLGTESLKVHRGINEGFQNSKTTATTTVSDKQNFQYNQIECDLVWAILQTIDECEKTMEYMEEHPEEKYNDNLHCVKLKIGKLFSKYVRDYPTAGLKCKGQNFTLEFENSNAANASTETQESGQGKSKDSKASSGGVAVSSLGKVTIFLIALFLFYLS